MAILFEHRSTLRIEVCGPHSYPIHLEVQHFGNVSSWNGDQYVAAVLHAACILSSTVETKHACNKAYI